MKLKSTYLKGVQNITYVTSKYDVLKDSDALVLLTEWKEFRSPDFEEIKTQLKTPVIFDGRNQYNAFDIENKGIEYYQIGKNISSNYNNAKKNDLMIKSNIF